KKLVTQSTLYSIWRQCNTALHLNGFATPATTFKAIDRDVQNLITARRHK
ncbi:hypothetical protein DY000_02042459, partial [Brassica cretica]